MYIPTLILFCYYAVLLSRMTKVKDPYKIQHKIRQLERNSYFIRSSHKIDGCIIAIVFLGQTKSELIVNEKGIYGKKEYILKNDTGKSYIPHIYNKN